MKYELWYSEQESSGVLLFAGDMTSRRAPDARIVWSVEAESYDEALRMRDEFLRSPQSEFSSAPTTRVTWGIYLNEDGEQTLEVPGWVGVIPHLTEYFAAQDEHVLAVLGQVYVERPYRDLSEMPGELTVVDLRSTDGMQRMLQEFYGRIQNADQISALIDRRLGGQREGWTIQTVHYLERPQQPRRE